MADIVLPATTEQERDDITKSHTNKFIIAMHKIAEPYEQAQNDYKIYCEILKQFGEKEYMAFSEGKSEMEWIRQFYDASKKKADASKIKMPEFEEFWKKGFVKFEIPKHAYEYVAMEEFRKNPMEG